MRSLLVSAALSSSLFWSTFAGPYVLQENWGSYAPYYPVVEYAAPPQGCEITQVNIIQRHGARYPTPGPGTNIAAAVSKLKTVAHYNDSNLNFIRNYTYDLGTSGDLVLFGAAQSLATGAEDYYRYKSLISKDNIPFVRASGSPRVIESATNWTYGFSATSGLIFNPVLSVILDESANFNDTLSNTLACIKAGTGNTNQTNTWIDIYTKPIVERLNKAAPGAELNSTNVYYLMTLCASESVAKQTVSQWCKLFNKDEWQSFEYEMDLDKYYGTGYGQKLGPVQGVGYINELIARLTNTTVNDTTQTNSTLDHSNVTFPLDRTVYADFSHDNQLISIFAAMGLFNQTSPLDPTKRSSNGTWVASQLVPFSGRMVVEKMRCQGSNPSSEASIRILVNNAVQPLEFCADGTQKGICTVSKFVQSQAYATSGGNGDWAKCFPPNK